MAVIPVVAAVSSGSVAAGLRGWGQQGEDRSAIDPQFSISRDPFRACPSGLSALPCRYRARAADKEVVAVSGKASPGSGFVLSDQC